ncbi:MAG: methylated-DNA--[protein]-cysteine S-methyltransferase [Synechococcales cyanobacterium]
MRSPSLSAAAVTTLTDDDHPTNATTYALMAKAIQFMWAQQRQQPDLATVAAHVHLSPHHFQRLFTRWAGISPKRFGQLLTVDYAKAQIAATSSLLDLTTTVGLSSPGRLHDLFVTLEAMSPGCYKNGGQGLSIRFGIHDSPFGLCLLASTDRGLCRLDFVEAAGVEGAEHSLRRAWPQAELIHDPITTGRLCDRIFHRHPSDRDPLVLWVKGTNFQVQVWRALLRLPPGGMTTYQRLATALGRPTAARAVGQAVGSNPIAYLIPCHRVLRASGALGGYHWGVERKLALLGWEAGHSQMGEIDTL